MYAGAGQYFESTYNLIDITQPVVFLFHLVLASFDNKSLQVFDDIVQILIMIATFSRLLNYIRYSKNFCMFVNIFTRVLSDLRQYLISYFVFIILFSVILILIQGDVES